MALTYGFFNAVKQSDGTYDRTYNSDQISSMFEGLISDGVFEPIGDAMIVKAKSGLTVEVGTGRMIIGDRWLKNDAKFDITLSSAHLSLNRYSAIVAKLDMTNRVITIEEKAGTAASNPSKPTMTNTETVKEKCLAYVYVAAGATSVSQSNITDMRADASCGWVTGVVKQVDTSELFLQWQTAYEEFYAEMESWKEEQQASFDSWFATLTGQLQVNTYIKEYKNIVSISGEVTEVSIGISEFLNNSDILFANINGVLLTENSDYTISGTGANAKIVLTNSFKGDNTVEFRVLKSKIGQSSNSNDETYANGDEVSY